MSSKAVLLAAIVLVALAVGAAYVFGSGAEIAGVANAPMGVLATSAEAEPRLELADSGPFAPAVERTPLVRGRSILTAACVDSNGEPVTGVTCQYASCPTTLTTDGARIRLGVEHGADERARWRAGLLAAGFLPRWMDVEIDRPEIDLGTIALVRAASVRGSVSDALGSDRATQRVECWRMPADADPNPGRRHHRPDTAVVSGSDGRFAFEQLFAGKYEFRAITTDGRRSDWRAAQLAEGAALDLGPLVLLAPPVPVPLTVLVVDDRGAPISDATVMAKIELRETMGSRTEKAVTDARGTVEFSSPERDQVELSVTPPKSDVAHGPAQLVLEGGGTFARVVLPSRPTMRLRLVDVQGEPVRRIDWLRVEPVRGVDPEAAHSLDSHELAADEGRYEIEVLPVRGIVFLRAARRGYAQIEYDPERASTLDVRVVLQRVGMVTGYVEHEGERIEGARVALVSVSPRTCLQLDRLVDGDTLRGFQRIVAQCSSDADGFYELAVESAGDYAVVAEAEHRGVARLDGLHCEDANEPRRLDFALEPAARIEALVLDGAGSVAPGVFASVAGTFAQRSGRTDINGRFLADALPRGRYEVSSIPYTQESKLPIDVVGTDVASVTLHTPWRKSSWLAVEMRGERASVEARLYTSACEPFLADTRKSNGEPFEVVARAPGPHILTVRRARPLKNETTLLVELELAAGENKIELEMPALEIDLEVIGDWREPWLYFRQVDTGGATYTRLRQAKLDSDLGQKRDLRGYEGKVPIGDGDVIRFDENGEPVVVVKTFTVRADARTVRVAAND